MKEDLYNRDFVCWTQETAKRLRAEARIGEADIQHLAEEIEDMGKRDRRAAFHRAAVLVAHLLKWKYQPQKRSTSGSATIRLQRTRLERILADSPSLRGSVEETWTAIYQNGITQAEAETGLDVPEDCQFTFAEALRPEFLP